MAVAPASFSAPVAKVSKASPNVLSPAPSSGQRLSIFPAIIRMAINPLIVTAAVASDCQFTRLKITQAAANLMSPPDSVLMTHAAFSASPFNFESPQIATAIPATDAPHLNRASPALSPRRAYTATAPASTSIAPEMVNIAVAPAAMLAAFLPLSRPTTANSDTRHASIATNPFTRFSVGTREIAAMAPTSSVTLAAMATKDAPTRRPILVFAPMRASSARKTAITPNA